MESCGDHADDEAASIHVAPPSFRLLTRDSCG